MQGKHMSAAPAARKRRSPAIEWIVIVLALVLLAVAGMRVFHWRAERQSTGAPVLVNQWNRVESAGFTPQLREIEGVQVDESLLKPLEELLSAARSAGFSPTVSEGYLTAEEESGADCRVPGESEHELGLAVHFSEQSGREADFSQWLQSNAWRWGFLLRYPESASEQTGIVQYNHYRYVGVAVAEQIRSLGISLEEYMDLFYGDSAEIIFEK